MKTDAPSTNGPCRLVRSAKSDGLHVRCRLYLIGLVPRNLVAHLLLRVRTLVDRAHLNVWRKSERVDSGATLRSWEGHDLCRGHAHSELAAHKPQADCLSYDAALYVASQDGMVRL